MTVSIIQADLEPTESAYPSRLPSEAAAAKNHLKKHRWTQEQAAARLNVTQSYLSRVLNGLMPSRRLLKAVMNLGPNPAPQKAPTYTLPA